jgi:hypothetical protein
VPKAKHEGNLDDRKMRNEKTAAVVIISHRCPGAQPARGTRLSPFRGAVAQGAVAGIPHAGAGHGRRDN